MRHPAMRFFLQQNLLMKSISRACRRIQKEIIWASDPSVPLLFSLRFGSDSVQCPDFLLGQFHQIPHQFVQIERHERPRPCHLQRLPQTFLRFVEFVPVAFQGPNHPFGLTPLAADLIPDCLGNPPRPIPFGLNPKGWPPTQPA